MRLNQVIALVQGKKSKAQKLLTTVHHGWHKDRITGITRTYQPIDEEGQVFPPESRIVQLRVSDALKSVQKELVDFLNIVATQEYANTEAKADVKVGKDVLLDNVPVSVLLFLEKQLIDLRTLAVKKTVKTQKKVEVIVKYEATKEHPAQTDLINVDKTIGHWTTIHLSGALPEAERDAIIERIEKLQDAVKIAREQANSAEVTMRKGFAKSILGYIFTSK
jgi:hypothetical protein